MPQYCRRHSRFTKKGENGIFLLFFHVTVSGGTKFFFQSTMTDFCRKFSAENETARQLARRPVVSEISAVEWKRVLLHSKFDISKTNSRIWLPKKANWSWMNRLCDLCIGLARKIFFMPVERKKNVKNFENFFFVLYPRIAWLPVLRKIFNQKILKLESSSFKSYVFLFPVRPFFTKIQPVENWQKI